MLTSRGGHKAAYWLCTLKNFVRCTTRDLKENSLKISAQSIQPFRRSCPDKIFLKRWLTDGRTDSLRTSDFGTLLGDRGQSGIWCERCLKIWKKNFVPKNRFRKWIFKNRTSLIRWKKNSLWFQQFWCQMKRLRSSNCKKKTRGQNINPSQSYGPTNFKKIPIHRGVLWIWKFKILFWP